MRISTFFPERKKRRLERRKGGGGRGGGGGGGRGGGSSGGSGGGRSVPLGGSGAGGRGTATAGGFGGGQRTTIPAGQPFAGRTQGGGTRNDVYGTSAYGSGYPAGYPGAPTTRGVAGAGFPFIFWPVVWGGAAGAGAGAYLHTRDYGDANNSSRPGGPLFQAPFQSATQNTTLHVIADNATTVSLIESITSSCSSNLSTTSISASQFDPNATNAVKPEQAVQYYRGSSVVLSLDGYNNTAALGDDPNAPPVPLPGWVDRSLLDCVNSTIGAQVPLVDSALSLSGASGMSVFGLVGLVLFALHIV